MGGGRAFLRLTGNGTAARSGRLVSRSTRSPSNSVGQKKRTDPVGIPSLAGLGRRRLGRPRMATAGSPARRRPRARALHFDCSAAAAATARRGLLHPLLLHASSPGLQHNLYPALGPRLEQLVRLRSSGQGQPVRDDPAAVRQVSPGQQRHQLLRARSVHRRRGGWGTWGEVRPGTPMRPPPPVPECPVPDGCRSGPGHARPVEPGSRIQDACTAPPALRHDPGPCPPRSNGMTTPRTWRGIALTPAWRSCRTWPRAGRGTRGLRCTPEARDERLPSKQRHQIPQALPRRPGPCPSTLPRQVLAALVW